MCKCFGCIGTDYCALLSHLTPAHLVAYLDASTPESIAMGTNASATIAKISQWIDEKMRRQNL